MLELIDIHKIYKNKIIKTYALQGINLKVEKGDFLTIMGPSGCGKSTLLNILGLMDNFTQGKYMLQGSEIGNLSEDNLANTRNKKIGFVFQNFNLIKDLTALENIEVPLGYGNIAKDERRKRAMELLIKMKLEDKKDHIPKELSGGQQQRVAIGRAIINNPQLILADEPTGNLDSQSSEDIMKTFKELNDKGTTIILVTHDTDIASWGNRIVYMKDGKILE